MLPAVFLENLVYCCMILKILAGALVVCLRFRFTFYDGESSMTTDEQEADWEVASEDTSSVALTLEFILWSSNGGRTLLLLSGCCFMVVLYFGATIFIESSLLNVIIGLIFAMADSLFGFGRVSRLL